MPKSLTHDDRKGLEPAANNDLYPLLASQSSAFDEERRFSAAEHELKIEDASSPPSLPAENTMASTPLMTPKSLLALQRAEILHCLLYAASSIQKPSMSLKSLLLLRQAIRRKFLPLRKL
jgi:hypothetical protein